MTFTSISALIFLASLPIIVALNFIRRHRTRLTVSSTFLWNEALKSYKRRFFLQTLLRNLPLALQIGAALLLVSALVDPLVLSRAGNREESLIIVVDTSASMRTMERGSTRLERALQQARETVQGIGERSRVLIVSGGSTPRMSGPFTSDRLVLRDHLNSIKPTDEPGDMERMLLTAAGFAPSHGDYRMLLFSDGAFDLIRPELMQSLPLDYIEVGAKTANVGIIAFTFREPPSRRSEYEILVGLQNSSQTVFSGSLTVSAESGVILENRIDLAPFEHTTLVFPYDGLLARRIRAEITPPDAFTVDNTAFASLAGGEAVRVHLITEGSFFLEQVLQSHPNIIATTSNEVPAEADFDIAIFDRIEPPLDFSGKALLIGTVDWSSLSDISRIVENPEVTGWTHGHPIIEGVDLASVSVYRSLGIPRDDPAITSIVHSEEISLVYTIVDDTKSLIGISFDVEESDLPLRAAFPILIGNILSWLSPGGRQDRQAVTGGTYPVAAPDADEVLVSRPDGSTESFRTTNGLALITGLDSVGFYTVRRGGERGGRTEEFAVNLLDPAESDLAPRFTPWESEPDTEDEERRGYRPLWRLLAFAALLLLLAEWAAWMRGKR